MEDMGYKVAEVIEIRGQKIKSRVFKDKNSSVLVSHGEIIRNASVGSYLKIYKGFNKIVCRVDGEYIQEPILNKTSSQSDKTKSIERILELSILGVLTKDVFLRGLTEIPTLFSEVFLLNNSEIERIFKFSLTDEDSVHLGNIFDYSNLSVYLPIQSIFASHIGVFGNTGSGKSNTLTKLYTECFNHFTASGTLQESFKKNSEFIIIDFNGEYVDESVLTGDKKVYDLSTNSNNGKDKIPVNGDIFLDIDLWSILFNATEKTQRPFLNRTIRSFSYYLQDVEPSSAESYLCNKIGQIIDLLYENPTLLRRQYGILENILTFFSSEEETREIQDFISGISYHGSADKLYIHSGTYYNNETEFNDIIKNPILTNIRTFSTDIVGNDFLTFEFHILCQFLHDASKNWINEEHVSPLIPRVNKGIRTISKVFVVKQYIECHCIQVFSLNDVNIDFKKIIPLIICKRAYEKQKNERGDKSLHIIIDEAHNILSTVSERESEEWKDYRLETFEEIIKEGRKFGTFLTISSQRPSDISPTIISQLHNYFIHRLVNNEDLLAINRTVAFIDNTSYEMIPVLQQGACIFTGISANFPVIIQVELLQLQQQPKSHTINLLEVWNQ